MEPRQFIDAALLATERLSSPAHSLFYLPHATLPDYRREVDGLLRDIRHQVKKALKRLPVGRHSYPEGGRDGWAEDMEAALKRLRKTAAALVDVAKRAPATPPEVAAAQLDTVGKLLSASGPEQTKAVMHAARSSCDEATRQFQEAQQALVPELNSAAVELQEARQQVSVLLGCVEPDPPAAPTQVAEDKPIVPLPDLSDHHAALDRAQQEAEATVVLERECIKLPLTATVNERPLERQHCTAAPPPGWEGGVYPPEGITTVEDFVRWIDHLTLAFTKLSKPDPDRQTDWRIVSNAFRVATQLELPGIPPEPLGPFTWRDVLRILRDLRRAAAQLRKDKQSAPLPDLSAYQAAQDREPQEAAARAAIEREKREHESAWSDLVNHTLHPGDNPHKWAEAAAEHVESVWAWLAAHPYGDTRQTYADRLMGMVPTIDGERWATQLFGFARDGNQPELCRHLTHLACGPKGTVGRLLGAWASMKHYLWHGGRRRFRVEDAGELETPTAPAHAKQADGRKRTVKWPDAAERMNRLRQQGGPFTSQPRLAEQLGCSPATINKAIRNTPELHAWANYDGGAAPRAHSISSVVTDRTAQHTEAKPEDDAAIREYLERDLTPQERAFFNGLSRENQVFFLDGLPDHQIILDRKP